MSVQVRAYFYLMSWIYFPCWTQIVDGIFTYSLEESFSVVNLLFLIIWVSCFVFKLIFLFFRFCLSCYVCVHQQTRGIHHRHSVSLHAHTLNLLINFFVLQNCYDEWRRINYCSFVNSKKILTLLNFDGVMVLVVLWLVDVFNNVGSWSLNSTQTGLSVSVERSDNWSSAEEARVSYIHLQNILR